MRRVNLVKTACSALLKTSNAFNRPVHLQIEPTSNCNLRCNFCKREKDIPKPKQLTFEQFKEVFDQAAPSRVSINGRGEPLMARDLFKMIAYAKARNCRTAITTNFTLGAKKCEELFNTGIDNIRVSIGTASPEVYESVRGFDLHGQVLAGLKKLSELKRDTGRTRPSVGFEVVITRNSIDDCMDIVKMAHEHGVERINFRPLSLLGVEERKDELLFEKSNRELLEIFHRIKNRELYRDVKTNVDELIADMAIVTAAHRGEINPHPECMHPWLQAYVNVDGECAPCDALNSNEGISMGNVFRDGFDAVWNGAQFRSMRCSARSKQIPFESCAHCPSKGLRWFIKKQLFLRT